MCVRERGESVGHSVDRDRSSCASLPASIVSRILAKVLDTLALPYLFPSSFLPREKPGKCAALTGAAGGGRKIRYRASGEVG